MEYIITPPEGFEKVETKYTNGNIHIIFKEVPQSVVPKNWEDFCKKNPITAPYNDVFITGNSTLKPDWISRERNFQDDRNLFSSKDRAKAMLAFIQLIRVRDYINENWTPDWEDSKCPKYIIYNSKNIIGVSTNTILSAPLFFKTPEIRAQFLNNFRDLIEEAKEFI